jgi:hypothetical protein
MSGLETFRPEAWISGENMRREAIQGQKYSPFKAVELSNMG